MDGQCAEESLAIDMLLTGGKPVSHMHRDFVPNNPLGDGPTETPETLLERLGFPHRIQHRQVMPRLG